MTNMQATPVRARRIRQPEAAPPSPPPAATAAPVEPARSDAHGPVGPVPAERVRKPLGTLRVRLDNAPIPGFHCHWFNDEKSRIKDALDAGYEHVTDADGKPVSHIVGTKREGGPLIAYRMKLPTEWWAQDQNAKVAARRQRQSDMQRGVTGKGGPGDDGRYLPLGPDGRPLTNIRNEAR